MLGEFNFYTSWPIVESFLSIITLKLTEYLKHF